MTADQITPDVARVLAPNPSMMTLDGTNTYLIGRGELAVVDPGPDLPEHVEAIVAALAERGRLRFACVTHHHDDHLPAARRLRERLGVPIVGHRLLPGVDRPLDHEEVLELGDARLRALVAPGHTADHLCYFLEGDGSLFTGDLIAGSGTVIVGEQPGDLVDYLASLRLVDTVGAVRILPGHGPVVDRPRDKIREYLDHRQGREDQMLAALRSAPRSVGALVEDLYADVRPELHGMAARNVRAQLYKLEHEGRVAVRDEVWHLVPDGS